MQKFQIRLTNKIRLSKKFKLTRQIYEDIFKEAQNAVQNLVRKKENSYFEEKLKANTTNLKKLWETVKQLGFQNI